MQGKPFLFDETFDGLDDTASAVRKPSKKFDEAAVAAEREAAFAKGFAEGETQGRTEAEAAANERHQNIRDVIARSLGLALSAAEASEAAVMAAAPAAAARAVESAFPDLAATRGGDEIRATIRDSLARAADEPRIVVRLAESDFEEIGAELSDIAAKAGFPGRIVSLEDAGVAAGDVRVEWADGGLARDLGRLTIALTEALRGLAAEVAAPQSDASAEPEAETPDSAAPGA